MSAEHRCDRRLMPPPKWSAPALVVALCLLLAPSALASGLGFGGPQVNVNGLQCATPGNCTAIGSYYDALGHGQAASWTETNGRWATGVELQTPSNAAVNGVDAYGNGGGITGLSCPTARNCAAIGNYLDPYGNLRAALFAERNGTWSTTPARMPGDMFLLTRHSPNPTGTAIMSGVSCVSAGNCVAVGYYQAKHGAVNSVMFVERGGSWGSATGVPVPPGGATGSYTAAELTAIDCAPGGICTGVGAYTNSAYNQQGWVVTISGASVQSSRELPMPSGPDTPALNPAPQLTSVSCTGAQDCAAAGSYAVDYNGQNNGNLEGVVLNEQSGTWAATEVHLPANAAAISTANAQFTSPLSVDCPDAGDCSAVGYYVDTNANIQGEVLDYAGGSWGAAQQVNLPGNASTASLSQEVLPGPVSCSGVGYCAASSVYVSAVGNFEPLLVYKAGGAWSSTPMQLPSDAGIDQEVGGLAGVSCPTYAPPTVATHNDCTVLGVYQNRRNDIEGFATSQTSGGSWGTPTALRVPGPSRAELRLSLASVLRPGANSHLRRIARRHGFAFHYRAVGPGKLVVTWRVRVGHRSHLIAHATVHPHGQGRVRTWMRLTGYARRLFNEADRLRLTTRVVFTPRGGRALTVTGAFTLHK